jgi:hypothetical protein
MAMALLASAAFAQATRNLVVGSGDPFIDVPAVQAAVDRGGTVILKGTFDFGMDAGNHIIVPGRTYADQDTKGQSTVFIYRNDVIITGEMGPGGELLTVIKNGMPPFWIGWNGETQRSVPPGTLGVDFGVETFPQDAEGRVSYRDLGAEPGYSGPQTRYARAFPGISASLRNLYFDSPKHYGVKATAGRDVFVLHNVFRNIEFGGLVHFNDYYGPGTSSGATRVAAGFVAVGMLYPPFLVPTITGRIGAEQNRIDGICIDPAVDSHTGECVGLGAIGTLGLLKIQQNDIRHVGRALDGSGPVLLTATSILLADNYAASPIVTENFIYNSALLGIWDFAVFAPSPAPQIEANILVDCAWIGIWSDRSSIGQRDNVRIERNFISQDGLLGNGGSAIVANALHACSFNTNTFGGDFYAGVVELWASTDCTLLMNRDRRKSIPANSPTYFLDTESSGNLIKAASGTALDTGTNNIVLLPDGSK